MNGEREGILALGKGNKNHFEGLEDAKMEELWTCGKDHIG